MRKVTQQIQDAFSFGINRAVGNTTVSVNENGDCFLYLHGNLIAKRVNGELWVTNAGWKSNVTKERLNGLPSVFIYQAKGVWYLNGQEWDGSWQKIN